MSPSSSRHSAAARSVTRTASAWPALFRDVAAVPSATSTCCCVSTASIVSRPVWPAPPRSNSRSTTPLKLYWPAAVLRGVPSRNTLARRFSSSGNEIAAPAPAVSAPAPPSLRNRIFPAAVTDWTAPASHAAPRSMRTLQPAHAAVSRTSPSSSAETSRSYRSSSGDPNTFSTASPAAAAPLRISDLVSTTPGSRKPSIFPSPSISTIRTRLTPSSFAGA